MTTKFPNIPLQPRATNTEGTNIVTGLVRLSYLHAFVPQQPQQPGGKAKYSVSVLIPKEDTATINLINAAREKVAREKWKDKMESVMQREGFKKGLRDGDKDRPEDEAYKGMRFFNALSEKQPQMINETGKPITDPNELRSGDFARVNISIYAYEKGGGIGIGFGLNNIQRIARGPALAGGPAAADVFTDPIPGLPAGSGSSGGEAGSIFD